DPSSWTVRGSYDGTTWTTIDARSDEKFAWRRQTRPFKIALPGRYKHYSIVAEGTLAEVELLGKPAPACTTTISDEVSGALTISSGVTCLAPGATVKGLVTVRGGASLHATGANLRTALTATGSGTVSLIGSTVSGSVTATGSGAVSLAASTVSGFVTATNSGPVSIESSTVRGIVTLTGGKTSTVVAGNTINGALTCTANKPAPVNNGLRNTGTGLRLGQCSKL
ncbi:MAG: glycoside hydrolase family 92 protein, partial [Actinomycetota bacterium]|nr:glycoside hydrolase family 92 protein [Actinomycetota bacterium]